MTRKEEQEQAFAEFQEWQKKQGHYTRKIQETVVLQKQRLDNSEPMLIPRGYVIAAGIGIIAMIVASFPILLIGIAIGAFLAIKLASSFTVK